MSQRDELLTALLTTQSQRHDYLNDAEFHAQIDAMTLLLPSLVAFLHQSVDPRQEQRRAMYETLVRGPQSTVFYSTEEIERMRSKGIKVEP